MDDDKKTSPELSNGETNGSIPDSNEIFDNNGGDKPKQEDFFSETKVDDKKIDEDEEGKMKEHTKQKFEKLTQKYGKTKKENEELRKQLEELQKKSVIDDDDDDEIEDKKPIIDDDAIEKKVTSILEKERKNIAISDFLSKRGITNVEDRKKKGGNIAKLAESTHQTLGVSFERALEIAYEIENKVVSSQNVSGNLSFGSTTVSNTNTSQLSDEVRKEFSPETIKKWEEMKKNNQI